MSLKKIIACNWKMNPAHKNLVLEYIKSYNLLANQYSKVKLVTFPPSLYVNFLTENCDFEYGLQDISVAQKGAFTGQISAEMAVDAGCKYVIVGHSETRESFGFTNQIIAEKFEIALSNNLVPVLCVGYSRDKTNTKINLQEISEQLNPCLNKYAELKNQDLKFLVAYEPVWAIGSGVVPTNESIFEVADFIQTQITEVLGKKIAENIGVLYGGSVNSANIQILLEIQNLAGFLIGGASLKTEEMGQITKSTHQHIFS